MAEESPRPGFTIWHTKPTAGRSYHSGYFVRKALGCMLVTLADVGTSSVNILTQVSFKYWKEPP